MNEQFEKWVMVASSGNADLTLNIHGEYDSPETSGFYELYKLARTDIEQQLAAVVSENAGLKAAAEFATAPDMWEELGGDVLRYQYKDWYADKLKAAMDTPATDTYLAEVRAQGVDALNIQFKKCSGMLYADSVIETAAEFAAQLRQGAEHE